MPDIMMRLGKDVLVAEGAMGTMLQRSGLPAGACCEQLNQMDPEMVENVHRLYHLAGADCVKTNSFGATAAKLSDYGLARDADRINREAVRIARSVSPQHILGDIGPCGRNLPPVGDAAFDDNFEEYRAQAASLAAEKPDAILIETMTDIADAHCALLAAKQACDLPVFVCCTFNEQGRMPISGTDPATAARVLEAAGADAVGINCGVGPDLVFPSFEKMAAATTLPLIVMPNAGLPERDRLGRVVYPTGPDEFARWAVRFADAGASIVGSCCGSTPAFTGAIKAVLAGRRVRPRDVRPAESLVCFGPRGEARVGGRGQVARIARVGDRSDPSGSTGVDFGEVDALVDEADDVEDAGAQALLISLSTRGGDVSQASALVEEVVSRTALPLAFGCADAARLEEAVRAYPGRALVDAGAWADSERASREAVRIAGRYGSALMLRALAAGPEYQVDVVTGFLNDMLDLAGRNGVAPADILVDVSSRHIGVSEHDSVLAVARFVRQRGCRLALDSTTWGLEARGVEDGAGRLAAIVTELGLDAVVVDESDPLVVRAVEKVLAR